MREIEIEGKTVEEAVAKGLEQLGVERHVVEVTVVGKGSSGLFGLGAKPARVVLRVREPGRRPRGSSVGPPTPPRRPSPPGSPRAPGVDWPVAEQRVKEVVQTLLRFMQIAPSELTTKRQEDRIFVNVKSPDEGLLIGREGQTLDALQLVVYLMVSRDEHTRVKVTLDVDGYRARAQERLTVEAKRIAAEVKRTGQTYHFRPMDAETRRVVHLVLADDPEVETVSEGEGVFRKVLLRPRRRAS